MGRHRVTVVYVHLGPTVGGVTLSEVVQVCTGILLRLFIYIYRVGEEFLIFCLEKLEIDP